METYWYKQIHQGDWKYELVNTVTFLLADAAPMHVEIYSADGRFHLATHTVTGHMVIHPGYQWDGATSAPDFPRVMMASLLHDILCQLCLNKEWPYTRKHADKEFKKIAYYDGFNLAGFYYLMIRAFGPLHKTVFKPKPEDSLKLDFL